MEILEVHNPFGDAPVFYLEKTNSTMEDASAFIDSGCLSGTVVCAGYQRRGKGRLKERIWLSEPGKSLLFTLILDVDRLPSGPGPFPLIAGLGLSVFLENSLDIFPRIKWPNDLLVDGRKIAGILCRLKPPWLMMGMGVNCCQETFPDEINRSATSYLLCGGKPKEPLSLLPPLLEALLKQISNESWQEAVERRLYKKNETVRIKSGIPGMEEEIEARILGITKEGALRLREIESKEELTLLSGEIDY